MKQLNELKHPFVYKLLATITVLLWGMIYVMFIGFLTGRMTASPNNEAFLLITSFLVNIVFYLTTAALVLLLLGKQKSTRKLICSALIVMFFEKIFWFTNDLYQTFSSTLNRLGSMVDKIGFLLIISICFLIVYSISFLTKKTD